MNIYETLINKCNKISNDWITKISLITVKNLQNIDCMVESKTFQMFEDLQRKCNLQGLYIGLDGAYRSEQEQANLYDDFCKRRGKEYADAIVAPVGTSEHHSGLAIDISISIDQGKSYLVTEKPEILKYDDLFKNVHKILPEYGFILRYPEGKEAITGYEYEPWHIRYVGVEPALRIYEKSITLEEWCKI